MEYVTGILLILVLIVAAGAFAWKQGRQLRWLEEQKNLSPEDRRYYRRQAYRRLLGCGLMIVVAVLICGLYVLGILAELDRLMDQGDAARAEGRKPSPEEGSFLRFSVYYLVTLALLVLALIVLAVIDLAAIRKFGTRHRKRIREDRQAMLARQLPLLYRERRNGGGDEPPPVEDLP